MFKQSSYVPFIFRNFSSNFKQKNNSVNKLFVNPIDNLEKLLVLPLFNENKVPFCASKETMLQAQNIFFPAVKHDIKLLASVARIERLPQHDMPEVVFLGRSNVGKSSLIKAMLKNAPDTEVRTSKKAGHTKVMNFFAIGQCFCLVDIPGYGQNQPANFNALVESYLKDRKNLKRTFLLMECDNLWTKVDNIALDMLSEFQIPYATIITKIDKCAESIQLKAVLQLMDFSKKHMSHYCFPQPFLCSAETCEGIGQLQAFICEITGALPQQNST